MNTVEVCLWFGAGSAGCTVPTQGMLVPGKACYFGEMALSFAVSRGRLEFVNVCSFAFAVCHLKD